jgi:serine/threonine protein kinase/Tol biopolymer transport system component
MLSAGTRLGPYEILSALGAGGMGEVYRARDTKLGRDVALKILPDTFAADPERLARFQREAQVLASLNHPHIGAIYGLEESDGVRALVLELVEGPTLADRIAQGAIPLDEALPIARQIAEALEAAHEQGVIHRDLKPANIKVRPDGTVKVLDFGLAKLTEAPGSSGAVGLSQSPTITTPAMMTGVGTILGTAAYMSPEQAKGRTADQRSDLWAFGCVLFEMLTGKRAFEGEDVSDTLAAVLRGEPDWAVLPANLSASFRLFVQRCLEKDRKKRVADISTATFFLTEPAILLATAAATPTTVPRSSAWRRALPWAAAVVSTIAALIFAVAYVARLSEEPRTLKMSILPPEKATFASALPAASPDGRHLAFVATLDGKNELWVRDLDSLAARPLPGTDDARFPFWKPDSRVIAFFASGKLKKIDVGGGPALTLCDAPLGFGGAWNTNDVIVFAPSVASGFLRVPAAGGKATPLTTLDTSQAETSHRYPWFLPDGHHFLYTARSSDEANTSIYVADLGATTDATTRRLVVRAASNAVFSAGYVLFMREQTLMAQPFDVRTAQTTGDAVPIAEHVDSVSAAVLGQFSASDNGVLAYVSGGAGSNVQLTWFDRSGTATGTLGAPGAIQWPAISPDGGTVAVDRVDQPTGVVDVWLHDLARGTVSRFTFGPKTNQFPVWSPDGRHIAFVSLRDALGHVYQRATAGAAQDEVLGQPLGEPPRNTRADDWSRDGRYLIEELARFSNSKTGSDIWVLPLFGDRKPFPYLQTEFQETSAKLSPNGQWLAYVSDETKRNEVYVQSFPAPGGKWQVSTSGGNLPIWSRDGNELFFIGADRKLMAVDVKSRASKDTSGKDVATFEAGVPKPLFETRLGFGAWYDVSKEGRFLMPTQLEQAAIVPMTVLVNWTAGLKR